MIKKDMYVRKCELEKLKGDIGELSQENNLGNSFRKQGI